MLRSDPSKNIVLLPTGKQICLKQNYIYSIKKIVRDGVQGIAIKIWHDKYQYFFQSLVDSDCNRTQLSWWSLMAVHSWSSSTGPNRQRPRLQTSSSLMIDLTHRVFDLPMPMKDQMLVVRRVSWHGLGPRLCLQMRQSAEVQQKMEQQFLAMWTNPCFKTSCSSPKAGSMKGAVVSDQTQFAPKKRHWTSKPWTAGW